MKNIALKDVSLDEIESLIDRVQAAINDGVAVAPEDLSLLLEILKSYLYIQDRLKKNDLTLLKLRKLLGMISSSEKGKDILPQDDSAPGEEPKENPEKPANRNNHGKRKASDFEEAKTQIHPLSEIVKGDECPHCHKGRLYKFPPSEFVRITGYAPFQATIHISEQVRCNNCQKVTRAQLPSELLEDGAEGQRFGFSAIALVVLMKYGLGFPFFRTQSLQKMLKVPISASTLWDLVEGAANAISAVWKELCRLAAQGNVVYADDTSNRILSSEPIMKKSRNSDKERLRSGVHTSCIVTTLADGRQISLFKTGINHAGEFVDEIMAGREITNHYFHMSDALSANTPKGNNHIKLYCNAHARRQFVDLEESFPEEVKQVIEVYREIYKIEVTIKEEQKDSAERLRIHKEQSLPLLEHLFQNLKQKMDDKLVEPNSSLGKAINYLLQHKDGLLGFTRYEGAPLDNNTAERELKKIILHRKNSMFFKNEIGSAVGDILTSVIQTAAHANINVFDYLKTLLRYADKVKKNPELYLPWNYLETISTLH